MKRVCVFLSAYNGEKYIDEQLDSIMKQAGVDVYAIVRDDGSTDNTVNIISKYKNVKLIKGDNIGCERSFYELLGQHIEADYYAYSDQDDVWMTDKLISAVKKLEGDESKPMVYGSNLMACDSKMNPIGLVQHFYSEDEYYRANGSRVFFNVQGCTLVWNYAMQEKLWKFTPDCTVAHHDSWINILANSKIGGGGLYMTQHLTFFIESMVTTLLGFPQIKCVSY